MSATQNEGSGLMFNRLNQPPPRPSAHLTGTPISCFLSTHKTLTSFSARNSAALKPAGPPPMTMTS